MRKWLASIDWSLEVPRIVKTSLAIAGILNAHYHFVPSDVLNQVIVALSVSGLVLMEPPFSGKTKT